MKTPREWKATVVEGSICSYATGDEDLFEVVDVREVTPKSESSRNELMAALEIAEKYVAAFKVMADKVFLNDTKSVTAASSVVKTGGDLISVRAAIANARKLAVNPQHSSQILTQNQIDVRDKGKEER